MTNHNVCIYGLNEDSIRGLTGYHVAACTRAREALRSAVGTLAIDVLIVDLDEPDSLNAIIEAREINSKLGIVGVTGQDCVKTVIAAQRAGCTQLAQKPVDPHELDSAIRRALNKSAESRIRSQSFAIFGATGGAGATTIACCLAEEAAVSIKANAALVDLDLDFGGIARAFDIVATHTIADLARAGALDGEMLTKAATKLDSGVSVFSCPHTIKDAHAIDEDFVRAVVTTAAANYDFVVLDLPRCLDSRTGVALAAADKIVIVLQLNLAGIANTRRFIDAIVQTGGSENKIEVVVNRFRKNVHSISLQQAEEQLGRKAIAVIPNDYHGATSAHDLGKPVDARNPIRRAVKKLAVALSGRNPVDEPVGWLPRLRRRKQAPVERAV